MIWVSRRAAQGVVFCLLISCGVPGMRAQDTSSVHTVVTVNAKKSEAATIVPEQAMSVSEGRKLQQVTGWTALRGQRSGLQLVMLLDDSSRGNLGTQLNDVKSFITALPPHVQIAIGYMRNGAPNLVQPFSTNHAQAVESIRLPSGSAGTNGSPWFCLSDLIKHWPGGDSHVRREVIMVTDGVDRYAGGRYDPENPYVSAATSDAQKAGVIVYSIYYKGAGRIDNNANVIDGGQNYLTQVSNATGGKVYLEGFGNPVSFAPFLSDIQRKLQNQYELTFESTAKPGLQSIKVRTSQPNTSLEWPAQVPVGLATGPQ